MKPTIEQEAILKAVRETTANLIVNARAGAAKTTSLRLIAEAVDCETLCLAFNKKIAMELQERMPAHVTASTLNSLGHRAIGKFLGKRLSVKSNKMYGLFADYLDRCQDVEFRDHLRENFTDILQTLEEAKTSGYTPDAYGFKPLVSAHYFYDNCDYICTEAERDLIDKLLSESLRQALNGLIDFNDQILLSACMSSISFPTQPLTMVDEAQDLSPLNHAMIKKVVRGKRLIAVGDEAQAIYGFRGASAKSMQILASMFDMVPLSLTVCFRCDQEIVRNAQWRAPDMHWAEGAALGSVSNPPTWSAEDIQDGDAIICRNNAPLFPIAVQLLRAGKRPEMAAGDIFNKIEKVLSKLGKNMFRSSEECLGVLKEQAEKEGEKKRDAKLIQEVYQCATFFVKETTNLGEALELYNKIKTRKGSILLSTGHRSKGREWDRVWFLDQFLIGDEDQERNVQYVIETRCRHALMYVTAESFVGFGPLENDNAG